MEVGGWAEEEEEGERISGGFFFKIRLSRMDGDN